jgi:hypothetical protein
MRIFGNVHVSDIQLLVQKGTKRIVNIRFSIANRFNFGAQQLYASRKLFEYVVLEVGFFIPNV